MTSQRDAAELSEQEAFGNLFYGLREGLGSAKRLMAQYEAGSLDAAEREHARRAARCLAVEGRIGLRYLPRMNERAPELRPRYASGLRVAARLAFCLHALAGEDPEPLALISPAELETILRDHGGDNRLEELVELVPADKTREDGV